jgi:hypothetical protein
LQNVVQTAGVITTGNPKITFVIVMAHGGCRDALNLIQTEKVSRPA